MNPGIQSQCANNRCLVVAYGNPYRRDDGVGLAIVNRLRQELGTAALALDEDGLDGLGHRLDTISLHQLLPELAETLAAYARVVFVDAHIGALPQPVRVEPVSHGYGFQAVTHHMSPGMLLSVTQSVCGQAPSAWLVSVRGTDFDFGEGLSVETEALVGDAVRAVRGLCLDQ
jgi:hydrogenase maturation protease